MASGHAAIPDSRVPRSGRKEARKTLCFASHSLALAGSAKLGIIHSLAGPNVPGTSVRFPARQINRQRIHPFVKPLVNG